LNFSFRNECKTHCVDIVVDDGVVSVYDVGILFQNIFHPLLSLMGTLSSSLVWEKAERKRGNYFGHPIMSQYYVLKMKSKALHFYHSLKK